MNQHANTPLKPSEEEKATKKSRKRKVNVADTSIESWHIIQADGQPQREKEAVYAILQEIQPATSRMISTALGIERTNITRSLKDLENDHKIKVAFTAPCKITGRRVYHYTLIDWSPANQQEVVA